VYNIVNTSKINVLKQNMCNNILFYHKKEEKPMLSQEIAELESENRRLKALLEEIKAEPAKIKDCTHCRFYM